MIDGMIETQILFANNWDIQVWHTRTGMSTCSKTIIVLLLLIIVIVFLVGGEAVCCAQFGEGEGEIFFDEVSCGLASVDIMDCRHLGFRRHNCIHSEDAGVKCYSK